MSLALARSSYEGLCFPGGGFFPLPSLHLTWWSLERKPPPWLSITIIITEVSAGPCSCTGETPQPRPLLCLQSDGRAAVQWLVF